MNAQLTEIFLSIQGEGIFIGYPQVFVRFADCNMSCVYCDTQKSFSEYCEFNKLSNEKELLKNPITVDVFFKYIEHYNSFDYHSISLTGGEPLLSADFLKIVLPKIKHKNIFLETNGILYNELQKIIDNIDIVSMDFKFNSVSGQNIDYNIYSKFIEIARSKNLYIKIVVSNDLTEEDIEKFLSLNISKHIPVVIQPLTMENNKIVISAAELLKIYSRLKKYFFDCRIIPQTHKFMGIL